MLRFDTVTTTLISMLVGVTAAGAGCQPDGGPLAQELDPFVTRAFELNLAPGMAVAVVQGDDLVYARGFGVADMASGRPVTPETLFYVASTTKSFTAFAAALLAQRGELDLDAPISRYLPALALQPPLSADDISLRDLLTHTHGIAAGGPVTIRTAFTGEFTNEQLIALLADYDAASSGRAFRYGNLGYNVAGLAMDAATGESWKEVLDREVFRPLGMTQTTAYRSRADAGRLALPYRPEPDGFSPLRYAKDDANMHAAGGHLTTVLDLAKYLEAHMNAGRVDGRQVFPAPAVAETHRQHTVQDRDFGPLHRHGWGLGWDLGTYRADTVIHRFGGFSGFHSHLSFMPEHRIGVAVLVNASGGGTALAGTVATYVYDRLLENPELDPEAMLEQLEAAAAQGREAVRRDRERRAARPQTLPHPLEAYAGVYESDAYGRMEWRVEDGKLTVTMGIARSDVEVYDGENNRLRVELTGGGSVVDFAFDGDRATGLTFAGREFRRTDG